ncbi:MAG TPA: FGGY-family carbohydrate kinase, partial [Acidimicrobiales bacterium]|nr:FGGY-family carbohydrate kinase [Acidimicrobiales bacterium]
HELTGIETGERTSAGTTALVDLATGGWSEELLADIAVDPRLLPPVASAGRCVGTWRGVSVHLVGGHDTASAVVAMPGPPVECSAFVSSGTWLLVGAERPEAETSDAARLANFSNERGALAGVRFLKNLAGLWLLEECRRGWGSPAVEELVAAAEAAGPSRALVDPNDARFVAPVDMEAEVRAAAGLPTGAGRDRVVRTIVESLAAATAGVVHELEAFLGRPVPEVRVLGGGARNRLLTRLTEEACGVPVRTGPGEATALGNALVQGIALGRFSGLTEARAALSPEAD